MIVQAALAAAIEAEPQHEAPPYADPEGFGVDLHVLDDAEPDHRIATGSYAVALDVARRYQTQLGSVPTDPDYGLPLEMFLHGGIEGGPTAWSAMCEHEARKDPRVEDATCNWVTTDRGKTYEVSIVLDIPTPNGVDNRELVFTVTQDRIGGLIK